MFSSRAAGAPAKTKLLAFGPAFILTVCLTVVSGSSWVGQHRISPPDSTFNGVPCIAMDSTGSPWVAWDNGQTGDSCPMYSRWLGDHFDVERPVAPRVPGLAVAGALSLAFDSSGRAWMSWTDAFKNDSNVACASRWQGSGWESPTCVNPGDTLKYVWGSAIASGGAEVWCAWSVSRTDSSLDTSTVFASRWDDAGHKWGPAMQVSQPDGGFYWWNNLVVDKQGRPYVFWCDPPRYRLWYSYYSGSNWSAPAPVNDTDRTTASPYADPDISIDQDGIMHVCYTGALIGASYRDIMYTWNDGTGWRPSVRATRSSRDSLYQPWYSSIAAAHRDDIWAVWDRQGEGSDQFRVYASHFDGTSWSDEERLDDDSAYYDGSPEVALDNQDETWVVWDGIDPNTRQNTIYYNRRVNVGVAESRAPVHPSRGPQLWVTPCSRNAVEARYEVTQPGRFSLDVYDRVGRKVATLASGQAKLGPHAVRWDCCFASGRPLPSGIYFCRLSAGAQSLSRSFAIIKD